MKSLLQNALVAGMTLVLASCNGFTIDEDAPPPMSRKEREKAEMKSIFTGGERGITLGEIFDQQSGGALPINALLWRASLDTVSVMPLASVDTFGGTILTEWYAHPENPSERIKLAIFIVDQELRSDALRVEVYVQKRPDGLFEWIDAGRDEGLATRLEDLILTRAREIRSAGISETN